MTLKDHTYKAYYSKAVDDIANDFYLPSLAVSKRYDRATGYFGSTVYLLSWSKLKEFVEGGGHMRIICSPYLTEQDQSAIQEGTSSLSSPELHDKLFKEFIEIFSRDTLSSPERVLACLISNGVIEIRIATGKDDPNRLFHDKVGIFYDDYSAVGFRGSINETFKGISDDGNFESFDVFTSWGDTNDICRLKGIENEFNKIWNNENDKIQTFEIPDSIKDLISSHAKKESHWTEALEEVKATINKAEQWSADKRKSGRKPRKHQLNALELWDKTGRRGIFEHATGSGKTFSAMCAIRKELEIGHPVLVLVPSVGLLDQWRKEIAETIDGIDINYLLCGGGNNQWKEGSILNTYSRPHKPTLKRIIIATMVTAASEEFRAKLVQSQELFIVADEVHRTGSSGNRKLFSIESGARLGLSATPRRYGDPEGTLAILDYFGGIIQPPYTLKNAIDDNNLCKYFYHPNIVRLTEEEQKLWDDISQTISTTYARLVGTADSLSILDNDRFKTLLLKRARIVKNAKNKVELAKKILLENYTKGSRWIVYCDNQGQMYEVLKSLEGTHIRAYEYHSELEKERKTETLKYFESIGGVVVSIKCLDEGIDIPATTHALILASSQNPREFIQRRGRVLRKSSNKNFAFLYDAIVIPSNFAKTDKQDRIVETELTRAIQFGEWSEDKKCIVDLRLLAIDQEIDFNNLKNTGIEDE